MSVVLDREVPHRHPSVRRKSISRFWKEHGFGYVLLLPVVLYIVVFQFYSLLETFRLSFFNYSLMNKKDISFAGLNNYAQLIFHDANFWPIFGNTLIWVLGSTLLQFLVAVPAALILNQKLRSRGFWRGLMMIPWVSPVIIIGIIWKWIYDGQFGLANDYLRTLHFLQDNIVWLGDRFWVWPALLLTSTWKGFPYVALMILSGLQGISGEMKEAAMMDGATAWQRFWTVVLPLLRPIMYVTGLTSIIASWTKFEMIWALTNGGPGYTTSILPTYLYTHAFVYFDFGKGSAIAVLSMILILLIVAVYAKLLGRETM
jgi:multiple sugar transport system permease protein